MMKLVIECATFLKALGHIQNVVERKNTIPILSNVLLSAKQNGLSLTTTDLEIEITETCQAEIKAEGDITAPVHTLYEIARKLPQGAQIELSADVSGHVVDIKSGKSSFSLQALPKDDFPSMTLGELPHKFSLPADTLKHLLDKSRFAISAEETRYYLNGIYLHVADVQDVSSGLGDADDSDIERQKKEKTQKAQKPKKGQKKQKPQKAQKLLRGVATDGHRLALVQTSLPQGGENIPSIIVPRKTVLELCKLLDEIKGNVSLELSDTKINLSFGDVVLTSKLIDGKFPDYDRVIPRNNDKHIAFVPKDFALVVDRVSAISSDKSRAVKLSLKKNRLGLCVVNAEKGEGMDELEVAYDGEALEIGFNARYLLDIVGQLEKDTAQFFALRCPIARDDTR